ncbi:MAG: DciA family protein, partial [Hyphomonadaceae bacterium]
MKHSHFSERRLADPRLEAAAGRALEQRRGRAAIAAAPRAGGFASAVLAPLLKESAASLGDLKRHWPEIVGDRLAGLTSPEKLAAGALVVRAHASAAPFVQHQAALIIERANLAG